MKVCPKCSFFNEEQIPACVICHTLLVDVPSFPSADPSHPEHERRTLTRQRTGILRRQMWGATLGYALAISATAAVPGLVFRIDALCLYFFSGLLVGLGVMASGAGQGVACFLQGIFSVALVVAFSNLQPFIPFMLLAHVVFPMLLVHWRDLIEAANR